MAMAGRWEIPQRDEAWLERDFATNPWYLLHCCVRMPCFLCFVFTLKPSQTPMFDDSTEFK
jgi:hypothetical protein